MKKIRILETREFVYAPDFDEEFYEDCDSIEEAIIADKKWIADKKGKFEDLDASPSTSNVKWQIYNDDTGEVIQEV
jgi:hypothetical protein